MANAMVMRASRRRRLLLLASCSLLCSPAIGGESIDRLGRLLGFGWSDGYHACGADCYHLGENLPPHSYAADHSLYAVSHQHAPVRQKTSVGCTDCDQNWSPQNQTWTAPARHSPTVLPMIEDSEFNDHGKSQLEELSPSDRQDFDASGIPAEPYTPTDPKPLPPVKKDAPKRTPTPQETMPDAREANSNSKPKPDSVDQILPAPIDEDSEELPPPLVEPTSPSDSQEARARTLRAYKRFAEADESERGSRPKRIGASNPQRLPSVAR